MKRIVSETLSLPELVKTPLRILLAINEGMNIVSNIVGFVLGGLVTEGGHTVKTSDKTNTVRGADKSKTVKTYKTDDTIRSD